MHGALLIYVVIAIEIFAIAAILKVLKDGIGGILKWAAYLALIVGILIMLCTVTQGLMRMAHPEKNKMENCCGWGGGHGMMMRSGHCDGEECEGMDDKACCKDSAKCKDMKGMHHMNMMNKDSAKPMPK